MNFGRSGVKEPLDFTRSKAGVGLRWGIPSHLLDAIFSCCGMPIVADLANSRHASKFPQCCQFHFIVIVFNQHANIVGAILDELDAAIELGFSTLQLMKSPHLALISKQFYE